MTCECVERVNRSLVPAQSRLETATTPSGLEVPMILTARANEADGAPIVLTANYCPFCGVKFATGFVCSSN